MLNDFPSTRRCFRAVYRSLRISVRFRKLRAVPQQYRPTKQESELYHSAEIKMIEAAKSAHRLWVMFRDWPDPIIGRAKRRLAENKRQRDTQRRAELIGEALAEKTVVDENLKKEIFYRAMK